MGVRPAKVRTQLYAWNILPAANSIASSAIDVSAIFEVDVFARIGRYNTATPFVSPFPRVRFEGSPLASGNHEWYPLQTFTPAAGSSVAATISVGTAAVGATSFNVASATNITVGNILMLASNQSVRVKSVSGLTIGVEEPLETILYGGMSVTDQAEYFSARVNVRSVKRVRSVADNARSGGATATVEVWMMHEGSVG